MSHKSLSLIQFVLLSMFVGSDILCAQTSEAGRKAAAEQFVKFPVNVRLTQDYVGGCDYTTKIDDNVIDDGRIGDAYRTSLNLTMPVYKGGAGIFMIGGSYDFNNVEFASRYAGAPDMGREHHIWSAQTSYIGSYKLWGRKLIAMANLKGEFSQWGFEHLTAIAMGMLQVKKSAHYSLSLGTMLFLNSSSRWPLIPCVAFRYKCSEKCSLDLLLPQLYLNYHLSGRDKISGGFSFSAERFYIRPNHSEMSATSKYVCGSLRMEMAYEHTCSALAKLFVKGGVSGCIFSRITENDSNVRFAKISQKPAPFLQVGFSYGMGGF